MADVSEEEDGGGEVAFTAALEAYLESQEKPFYQPRIQQKPVSTYKLWSMVMEAGGAQMVRPCLPNPPHTGILLSSAGIGTAMQ